MKSTFSLPRDATAALFIDMQEEHRADPRYVVDGYDRVLANARRVQDAARAARVPLIHFEYIVDMAKGAPRPFHPVDADGRSAFSDATDPNAAICAEVAPREGETVLVKDAASCFREAGFEPLLRVTGIEWLVVCGVWTEACIDATVKDAVDKGFRVLLVKDACGSATAAMHRTGILNLANRLYGGAVTDTAGACRLLAGEAVDVWRVQGSVPIRYGLGEVDVLYESL